MAMQAVLAAAVLSQVEQVHIALGQTQDVLTVSWASGTKAGASPKTPTNPQVKYGTDKSALTMHAAGDMRAFTVDSGRKWYTHIANMTGLKLDTEYYYQVGDDVNGYTEVFSVRNRRQRNSTTDPYRHIILGDMGTTCAFALCTACTQSSSICDAAACSKNTSVGLISETATADMFLHVGDFAYNMGSDDGKVGDQFFRNIEQVAANNVYMVSHGNHEDDSSSLAHYIESFRGQPSNADPLYFNTANGRALNTLYFSWDHGLIHYVSISTELFYGVKDENTNVTSLMAWLRKDLARANRNRHAVPWVMVEGHRSVYCTATDCGSSRGSQVMQQTLEPVLFEYGVDLFVNGHEHNYERTWPLYEGKATRSTMQPKAPIYVVSGAAGSHELHDPFTKTQPQWSAFRSNSFSYSRVLVHNYTHLHWQQIQTDPTYFPLSDYGRVIDDWWIVQDNHGPFNPADAPKTLATDGCHDSLCQSHDHWEPMLQLPRLAGEKFVDTIARFRREHGEEAWRAKLRSLMAGVHRAAKGSNAIWEDVHEDGNSDDAWLQDPKFKWRGDSA